ncbi:MAG: hypothetical protein K2Q21_04905 [Chitinophagaceae bacterium]|nr:hypothetical protein [Chitinophagaceae bacterium]
MRLLCLVVCLSLLISGPNVRAQLAGSNDRGDTIHVSKIVVTGNKRTKLQIVLRELSFHRGDAIAKKDLLAELQLSKQQLLNTTLFVDVRLDPVITDSLLLINVDVKERWYLFPLLYFKLIDRNFNQWWVDQHRSLARVNYGIKFIQNNFTGKNDNLDIWLITGYTQQITLRYDLPFVDTKLRSGFNVGFVYASQKELNYATENNKQQFFREEDVYVKKQTRVDLTYSYRPGITTRHFFRIAYNKEFIADTVNKINPNYFPNGKTQFEYVDFNYSFRYYNSDHNAYPTKGFLFQGNLYKRGLSKVNDLWMINARAVFAQPLSKKSFLHFEGLAQLKFPTNPAFLDQKMFGYGSFQMRGLEYNVIDGMSGLMLKSTIHHELTHFEIKNPFKSRTHDRIPFRIYMKAYGDLGYAHNANTVVSNTLNNTLLRTWGFGMDIISIYDFVFKIEYSFNQLGKEGLYLQSRNDF